MTHCLTKKVLTKQKTDYAIFQRTIIRGKSAFNGVFQCRPLRLVSTGSDLVD